MAIVLSDFNKIWASTSPLTPYSFTESNYKEGWNFIGATPPARQMWDSYFKWNDEKQQYIVQNFLPLSGGTLTGDTTISKIKPTFAVKDNVIERGTAPDSNYSQVEITSYDKNNKRCWGLLHDYNTNKTNFIRLIAYDGTTTDFTNNGIGVGYDGSGNVYTSAPTPAKASNDTNIATTAFVKTNLADYLPLSGGTLTGNNAKITMSNGESFITTYSNGLYLGGTDGSNGSTLALFTNTNGAGFQINAGDGTTQKRMVGKPDGTLTWDGQPIQTSSDRRLKQDFSDIPADVLEAWGKINWTQFKYKADVERKGAENCRFHVGLVAQDVKDVGEENNVDLLKYGILCHDVREAVEEEKDEDGNVVREASEAVDLWTVRYEEALAMEVIYLRNEIKKLREEISKLK